MLLLALSPRIILPVQAVEFFLRETLIAADLIGRASASWFVERLDDCLSPDAVRNVVGDCQTRWARNYGRGWLFRQSPVSVKVHHFHIR
jgi:hypothetical protein